MPSFSFGENELFRQVVFEEGSWMRAVQQRFQKMMGFAPCVFYGRGLTSVRSRGFLPYARPITTVGEQLQRVCGVCGEEEEGVRVMVGGSYPTKLSAALCPPR